MDISERKGRSGCEDVLDQNINPNSYKVFDFFIKSSSLRAIL